MVVDLRLPGSIQCAVRSALQLPDAGCWKFEAMLARSLAIKLAGM